MFWVHRSHRYVFNATLPSTENSTPSASSSICCNLVRIACAPRRDLALRFITAFPVGFCARRRAPQPSPALCAGSARLPGLRPRRRSLQRFCGGRLRGRKFTSRPNPRAERGAKFVGRAFARGCLGFIGPTGTFSTPPSHPPKTRRPPQLVRIACAPRRDLALRLITAFPGTFQRAKARSAILAPRSARGLRGYGDCDREGGRYNAFAAAASAAANSPHDRIPAPSAGLRLRSAPSRPPRPRIHLTTESRAERRG